MTIIVEDGTGLSTAETYISVADADTYFSNRANTTWSALTTANKEASLRKAADYLLQVYRLRWKGTRVNSTQALDWPRSYVARDDYTYSGINGYTTIGGNYYYPSDEVPTEVARACAELAVKASADELSPDLGRRTIREKVDVIEVEYDPNSPQSTIYRAIDNMLAPFLNGGGAYAFRTVIRT
jgi:hypothetical protein